MMIERGAFAEVEVALMAHPAPADTLYFPFRPGPPGAVKHPSRFPQ
jgi:hypothetical protein